MHDYSEEGNTVTMNAGLPFSLMRNFRAIEAHLKQMGIPDHPTCLLRNLYAGQETTVRTGHGTTDWFQIRKRSTSRLYIVTLLI